LFSLTVRIAVLVNQYLKFSKNHLIQTQTGAARAGSKHLVSGYQIQKAVNKYVFE